MKAASADDDPLHIVRVHHEHGRPVQLLPLPSAEVSTASASASTIRRRVTWLERVMNAIAAPSTDTALAHRTGLHHLRVHAMRRAPDDYRRAFDDSMIQLHSKRLSAVDSLRMKKYVGLTWADYRAVASFLHSTRNSCLCCYYLYRPFSYSGL